jgi:SPP1 gp7 family putative phage head morphogenesis protein
MAKKLKPVKPFLIDEVKIGRIILKELYEIIFKPVVDQLDSDISDVFKIKNAKDNLAQSLMSGKISYDGYYFTGKFNSEVKNDLRKIGATYNREFKSWKLERTKLPPNLVPIIVASQAKTTQITKNIINALDNINTTNLLVKYRDLFTSAYYNAINRLDTAVTANLKEAVSIIPQLSDKNKINIATAYSENLEYYIKDFADKEIIELRKLVEKNVYAGNRADKLEEIIIKRYGVSARKAKFLANQETSLLTSKYTVEKYQNSGIEKYMWSASGDVRVRPMHKELNNKIFYFSNPPITNIETGAKNNPGEDYGCRCVAIPIID